MNATTPPRAAMHLPAGTAAGLMTTNPVSLEADATLREAVALLADRGISAAPVIDQAGRPVGVFSRSDVLRHDREEVRHARPAPEFYTRRELELAAGEELPDGFQVELVDATAVQELMTPAVFSVPAGTPVDKVVEQLVALDVHRLFVVDPDGVLVGVVTAMDILRHLRR
jgi:CBS domain-containing protein